MPSSETSHNMTSAKIRYYIVEDYHLTRMGLISALSEYTHLEYAGEAETAEDALNELAHTHVDVLILDLGLPGMNGIELSQILRERYPDIKIIILTSHNQTEEVMASLGAGAQAYALKGIRPERLVQVIDSVHEGAAWIDPGVASVVLATIGQDVASGAAVKPKGISDPVSLNRPAFSDLTEREREVLQLIVQGKNNQDISDSLHISIHTTKAHVGSILSKLCVNDRVQAAIKALKENIV